MPISRRHFLAGAAALPTLAAPSLALAQAREFRKVADDLKAATNGRLTMTVFHSGQLGNEAAMLQQMQSGALDMGWIMAAELGSRVPTIAAITAPYVVDSTPKIAKLVRHPVALKLFDVLPKETGTIGLAWGITGMRAIFSAKDISTLADIKGMKLRINPTPVYRDFYQALGAAPTPIPTPAVFDAMTNGQVDGLETDLEFSWNQRFDKVSKVMLQMNAVFMPVIALVSGRVWTTLPDADKEVITKTVKAALDTQVDELAGNEPKLIEQFRAAPITIRTANRADAEAVVAEFDKVWLPKAPVLADLRKVGATL
jgi:TRAP-type C4-dicarboxylate transport system substrate-binding protein